MARQTVGEALLKRGLAETMDEARLLIMEGKVFQGAEKVKKCSDPAREGFALEVRDRSLKYVSRGGLKLEHAMKVFDLTAEGRVCLDVGASTGGFTEVMLNCGASRVYAVDVGFGVLHWKLRQDERVTVMERVNARFLTTDMFDARPSFGATDVSFISLKAILPPALAVLDGDDRVFVALIKPQFEAPREKVSRGGIVRDSAVHIGVCLDILDFAAGIGWPAFAFDRSPIRGNDGNTEFLVALAPRSDERGSVVEDDVIRAVQSDTFRR